MSAEQSQRATAAQLLSRARSYLDEADAHYRKGNDFYLRAAESIAEAMAADPSLSFRKVGREIGRGHVWVSRIVRWAAAGGASGTTPFAGERDRESVHRVMARRLIKEEPECLRAELLADPAAASRFAADLLAALADVEETVDAEPDEPAENVLVEVAERPDCFEADEVYEPGEYERQEAQRGQEALRALDLLRAFSSASAAPPPPEWEEELRQERAERAEWRQQQEREDRERHEPVGRLRRIVGLFADVVQEACRFDLKEVGPLAPDERERFRRVLRQAFVVIRQALATVDEVTP